MTTIRLFFLAALMLPALAAWSQRTGQVAYPELGIAFTVPEGWTGQEGDGVFLMGSHTEAGLILVMPNEYRSLDALRQEAAAGISDQGVDLRLSGQLEAVGANGAGGEFAGTIQGQAARAYILGLINQHGQGLTVMAATETGKYGPRYRELALALARSVQFSAPQHPPVVLQWQNELKNVRLAYRSSNYSQGVNAGDYTSMSEREEIWLCAAGYFEYESRSSSSFDTSQAMAGMHNGQQGSGAWEVTGDGRGGAQLRLTFYNGKVNTYSIDGAKSGKLYLSGYGYFFSQAGERCR